MQESETHNMNFTSGAQIHPCLDSYGTVISLWLALPGFGARTIQK